MQEESAARELRRNRLAELTTEIEGLSEHYQNKLELQERMTTWCTELMDDLLLIDFEDLEHSRYRGPVGKMRSSIQECWHRIEICYGRITTDIEWLRNRVDIIQPELSELWWLMAEDIIKRQVYIQDLFMKLFELKVEFKELIQKYSEKFKDDPHLIFEKYRHFS